MLSTTRTLDAHPLVLLLLRVLLRIEQHLRILNRVDKFLPDEPSDGGEGGGTVRAVMADPSAQLKRKERGEEGKGKAGRTTRAPT